MLTPPVKCIVVFDVLLELQYSEDNCISNNEMANDTDRTILYYPILLNCMIIN